MQRPGNGNRGVIPLDATLVIGVIHVIALVGKDGGIGEHIEAVRKATRNEELLAILAREYDTLPGTEGGAALPQVHAHIEDLSRDDPHELGLRMLDLEVQTAQHIPRAR